jgi:hypothetical protein
MKPRGARDARPAGAAIPPPATGVADPGGRIDPLYPPGLSEAGYSGRQSKIAVAGVADPGPDDTPARGRA